MFAWMRSNGRFLASIAASGVLSRSEIGLWRETSIIAASQRAPLFMMCQASVR